MWFKSSTQPISISRSPDRQSRPVVSVSKTISRMFRVLVRFASGTQDGRVVAPPKVEFSLRRRGEAPAGSRRPGARRRRSPWPESTRKCARWRFSASGIWRASSAASFASVMPGRASTRARWISGSAVTTTMTSARSAAPVSKRSGTSISDQAASLSPRSRARNASSLSRTSGCTIASSRASAAGSPTTRSASRARSIAPSAVTPGNAASIGATAAPAIEAMHGRIGIVHRNAAAREHRRGRALAHADRSGEADDAHVSVSPSMSATIRSRSSASTVGRTPNQRSKPGTA